MLPSAWASLKAEWARVVAARRGPKVRVDVGEEMEPLAEALAGVCAARARRVRARRHCKRLPQPMALARIMHVAAIGASGQLQLPL